MKNEKTTIFCGDCGSNKYLKSELTMLKNTTTQNKFQYYCGFCLQNLRDGSTRFNGFGACPRCYRLAHRLVNGLRAHWAKYFSNLGVRK